MTDCNRCEYGDDITHAPDCPNDRPSLWRRLFGRAADPNPSITLNRSVRRHPGVTYFGIPLPTSNRAFPRSEHAIRYAKFPTSSLDWQGSDWESPTALTFTPETITRERVGTAGAVPTEGLDPEQFAHRVHGLLKHAVADTRHLLKRSSRVMDTAGLTVRVDPVSSLEFGAVSMMVIGDTWPAVPGVTVPAEDTTL